MIARNPIKIDLPVLTAIVLCFSGLEACDSNAPLDADTRMAIDSIATARISKARLELDSLCAREEEARLPVLVDSIKKVRLQEIERHLKSVPK